MQTEKPRPPYPQLASTEEVYERAEGRLHTYLTKLLASRVVNLDSLCSRARLNPENIRDFVDGKHRLHPQLLRQLDGFLREFFSYNHPTGGGEFWTDLTMSRHEIDSIPPDYLHRIISEQFARDLLGKLLEHGVIDYTEIEPQAAPYGQRVLRFTLGSIPR